MPFIRAAESLDIPAPSQVVYDIIADYREGHPRILPPEYFGRLEVDVGGRGAGTKIRFEMKAFGRTTLATASVTEPVPGHELHETLETGILTTFLVESQAGASSRVTITTSYTKAGLAGWVERFLAPAYLRRVYKAELKLLAHVATDRVRAASR
jgi:hypothetical protein